MTSPWGVIRAREALQSSLMAPKKTTRKKAAKKTSRKPSAKSAKKTRRASKAPKKVAPKKKVAKKPVARKAAKKAVAKKAVAKKAVAKKPAKKAAKKPAAKKAAARPAAKKAAARPAAKKAAAAVVRHRDNSGHLDPAYAAKLREQSGESSPPDHAFLDGPRSNDSLAEELGEETVGAMTSGEDESDRLDQEVDEDGGGPFVETDGSDEFADGTDESNPESATREPFPTS